MAENGMRVGPGSSAAAAANANANAAAAATSNGEHEQNEHNNSADNEKAQPARLNESAQKYMQELMNERSRMENLFPLAIKLIDEGMKSILPLPVCVHTDIQNRDRQPHTCTCTCMCMHRYIYSYRSESVNNSLNLLQL